MTLPVFMSEDDVSNRVRNSRELTVIYASINDFNELCAAREVNGTRIYSELEQQFGEVLPQATEGYKIPREGFVYFLDASEAGSVEVLVEKLIDRTKSPFTVGGESFNVTVSIGVARREENESPAKLLDRAQFAQCSVSDTSESYFEFYDSSKARDVRNEINLKNDLYSALECDEFFLRFQPVVSLEDCTVRGAEALVRWDHPERGLVSPGEFIPLAEKTGQILFLDRWVLKTAISRAADWNSRFDADIPIGINISAWQFRDDYLVKKIDELLDETQLPPSLVKIEVTETSMMKNVDRTARVLKALKDLGVRIALDDFGTGHATFEYLAQFPIDELKIDRSFLDFDDVYAKNQKLIDIMIQTGQRVGTDILAEGIETEQQLHFLRNRGCQKAQGFLFSKPVSEDDFCRFLDDGNELYPTNNEN